MEIDDLTEKQAKQLVEFIGQKAGGKLCIRFVDINCLMFMPKMYHTYFYVGYTDSIGCSNNWLEIADYNEPYKQMLKRMFDVTCRCHQPLFLPGITGFNGLVAPKDKTLEEWLVQMDLES